MKKRLGTAAAIGVAALLLMWFLGKGLIFALGLAAGLGLGALIWNPKSPVSGLLSGGDTVDEEIRATMKANRTR